MITLHPRTVEDVRRYFAAVQDDEIRRTLPSSAHTLEDALRMFHEAELPGSTSFGRTIRADGEYVGDVWCYCIGRNERPNAMLSYCVFDKAYWRKGVATQAVQLFLQDVRKRFRLESIGAFTYADHTASIRVLEKCGFLCQERFTEEGRESAYYERTFDA